LKPVRSLRTSLLGVLKYGFTLAIGIALIAWAFKDVPFESIIDRLLQVKYQWVLFSITLGVVSHWLRAYRWNMLLEPVHGAVSTKSTFPIVLSMYLVNLIIPRGGEFYRCIALKKTDGVPISTTAGSVIAERVVDLGMLILFLIGMFFIEAEKFQFIVDTITPQGSGPSFLLVFSIGLALIVATSITILVFKSKLKNHKFTKKLVAFIKEIIKGFIGVLKLKNRVLFLAVSLGIWVCYYLMSYVMIFASPETDSLSFEVGIMLLALGGIAMSAPIQGGIGAFHILVGKGLALYDISNETGIFFATLLHGSQVVMILFTGTVSFLYLFLFQNSFTDLNKSVK